MARTGRPLLANRDTALYLGLAAWGIGTLLLWDAWENRGRPRPFAFKLAGLFP
jgi:hypothetical protein